MSYTFSWSPSYGSNVATKPEIQPINFGDGYELRMANGINSIRRKWAVTFEKPSATADEIEAFFRARGAVQSFSWMPPHGSAGKWIAREWADQKTGPFTRTITASFEEVFEQ